MSDVCSLLSEATASAILGAPAQTQTTDPATICEWKLRSPGSATQPLWISLEWPGLSEVDRLAQLPDFGVPALSVQAVTALPAKALWIRLRDRAFTDYALVVLTSSMKMTVYASARDEAIRVARESLDNLDSTP